MNGSYYQVVCSPAVWAGYKKREIYNRRNALDFKS